MADSFRYEADFYQQVHWIIGSLYSCKTVYSFSNETLLCVWKNTNLAVALFGIIIISKIEKNYWTILLNCLINVLIQQL